MISSTIFRWLMCDVCGWSAEEASTRASEFFLSQTLKVVLLVLLIATLMGLLQKYFPPARLRALLEHKKMSGLSYLAASLFGAITPFCSCSSIPLFIGFIKAGLPIGVGFSFLITSPLINEIAIAMLLGSFGLKITLLYLFSGVALGTLGGVVMNRLCTEEGLQKNVRELLSRGEPQPTEIAKTVSLFENLKASATDAWNLLNRILPYLIAGIGLGALMHGYLPAGYFEKFLQSGNILAVPVAVLSGIPFFSQAAGIVPVVEVMVQKGIPLGVALAFMMSVVGLSLPEATLLKTILTWRTTALFFGVVAVMMMVTGYILQGFA